MYRTIFIVPFCFAFLMNSGNVCCTKVGNEYIINDCGTTEKTDRRLLGFYFLQDNNIGCMKVTQNVETDPFSLRGKTFGIAKEPIDPCDDPFTADPFLCAPIGGGGASIPQYKAEIFPSGSSTCRSSYWGVGENLVTAKTRQLTRYQSALRQINNDGVCLGFIPNVTDSVLNEVIESKFDIFTDENLAEGSKTVKFLKFSLKDGLVKGLSVNNVNAFKDLDYSDEQIEAFSFTSGDNYFRFSLYDEADELITTLGSEFSNYSVSSEEARACKTELDIVMKRFIRGYVYVNADKNLYGEKPLPTDDPEKLNTKVMNLECFFGENATDSQKCVDSDELLVEINKKR